MSGHAGALGGFARTIKLIDGIPAPVLQKCLVAAAEGDAVAQYILGSLRMTGLGTGRDPAKAAESYRKDAERGIPEAQTILGCLCESGSGVAKDPAKAAEGGFPPA